MLNWVLRWVISGVALAIVTKLHIGVQADTLLDLALATLVIGLLNSLVRPVLGLLTMPINCLTFGLFGFVLNAILFASVHLFVPGFHVTSLLGAVLGPILMGIIGGLLSALLPDRRKDD